MGAIRSAKARRGASNGGPLPPTSHPTHVKAQEKKLLTLNTSFLKLRLAILCGVIVFSLAVVFEILVLLTLDPLGVEFDPPKRTLRPSKTLISLREFITF